MKRDVRVYIKDIFEAIEKKEEYTKESSEEDFCGNTQLQDAVLRYSYPRILWCESQASL